MYFPTPWWATKECSPNSLPWSCVTGLDFGSTGCTAYTGLADEDFEKVKENNYYEHKDSPPGCSKKMELTSFFTNFTFVEKRTLDDKFIDKDGTVDLAKASQDPYGIAVLSVLFKVDNKKAQVSAYPFLLFYISIYIHILYLHTLSDIFTNN